MAQGSVIVFNEFKENISSGSINLATDNVNVRLISNSSLTAAATSPDSADFTQVTGGSYAEKTSVSKSWSESGGTATFALTTTALTWTQDGAGPTDIRYALVYSATHAGTEDGICLIDMTTGGDGVTAISLQDGDITINIGTLFTIA